MNDCHAPWMPSQNVMSELRSRFERCWRLKANLRGPSPTAKRCSAFASNSPKRWTTTGRSWAKPKPTSLVNGNVWPEEASHGTVMRPMVSNIGSGDFDQFEVLHVGAREARGLLPVAPEHDRVPARHGVAGGIVGA